MKKPKSYPALTVMKKGRLSKKDIADPKVGLSLELKKQQAQPVDANLVLIEKKPLE